MGLLYITNQSSYYFLLLKLYKLKLQNRKKDHFLFLMLKVAVSIRLESAHCNSMGYIGTTWVSCANSFVAPVYTYRLVTPRYRSQLLPSYSHGDS